MEPKTGSWRRLYTSSLWAICKPTKRLIQSQPFCTQKRQRNQKTQTRNFTVWNINKSETKPSSIITETHLALGLKLVLRSSDGKFPTLNARTLSQLLQVQGIPYQHPMVTLFVCHSIKFLSCTYEHERWRRWWSTANPTTWATNTPQKAWK